MLDLRIVIEGRQLNANPVHGPIQFSPNGVGCIDLCAASETKLVGQRIAATAARKGRRIRAWCCALASTQACAKPTTYCGRASLLPCNPTDMAAAAVAAAAAG